MAGPRRKVKPFTVSGDAAHRNGGRGGDRAYLLWQESVKHPSTSEEPYSDEELEFLRAVQDFQARTGIRFLCHSHYLKVLKDLGYTRTAEPGIRTRARATPRARKPKPP